MSEDHKEMSIIDHLEELRWVVLRSLIAIVIAALVVFIFDDFFFDSVIFGPANANFVTYQWLCKLGQSLGADNTLCIEKLNFTLQNTETTGQFMVYIHTGFIIGFIIAFPVVFYQFWGFVRPALYDNEYKVASGLIFWSTLLFILGVLFAYFILIPITFNFLSNFSISNVIKNDINLNSYFELMSSLTLGCAIMFELPIVVYFLTKIGILSPEFMQKHRKYSIVIILLLAAIITPPDVISQLIISIPLFILYEISIYVSMRIIIKQKLIS